VDKTILPIAFSRIALSTHAVVGKVPSFWNVVVGRFCRAVPRIGKVRANNHVNGRRLAKEDSTVDHNPDAITETNTSCIVAVAVPIAGFKDVQCRTVDEGGNGIGTLVHGVNSKVKVVRGRHMHM
jgi:hypothetical protein